MEGDLGIGLGRLTGFSFLSFGHSALLLGDKIVVFGGWNGKVAFNDLWVYDTGTSNWIKARVGGTIPAARHGHTMELLDDGRLVLFGGYTLGEDGAPVYVNDVRELDTDSMSWRRSRGTCVCVCERDVW